MKFKLKIVRANCLIKMSLLSAKRIIGSKRLNKEKTYYQSSVSTLPEYRLLILHTNKIPITNEQKD